MRLRLFKGSGILNLLGMTVAFAALYILLVQVCFDFGYNKEIKDKERVFVMGVPSWFTEGHYQLSLNRPIAKLITEQSPLVEACGVARLNIGGQSEVYKGEGEERQEFKIGISELTSGAVKALGLTAVTGTFEGMGNSESVAISVRAAELIGAGIGDAVTIQGFSTPKTIVAVYENMPMNSDLGNTDMFFSNDLENRNINNWGEWGYKHIVKLHNPDGKLQFEKDARASVEKVMAEELRNSATASYTVTEEDVKEYVDRASVTLFTFHEIYFSSNLDNWDGRIGNRTTSITLLLVAIIIVVITLINFVNFFFAQVPVRVRAVNTRKILGSSRGALVKDMMVESGMLVAISLCAAVALVVLFKGSDHANLISCTLAFGSNLHVVAITVCAALVMTVAASVYPSLYITSFPPALAVKGTVGSTTEGKVLRYSLIMLQFVVSISFVVCAMFIKRQHAFMMDYDMGFNKEYLLTADIPIGVQSREPFSQILLQSPAISDVAWAAGPLVNTNRMSWGRSLRDEPVSFDCYPVSWNFLRFMDIEVLEGRDFMESDEQSENGVFIFNQVAKNKFGLTLEDRITGHRDETEIAGFCEDMQYKPLQYELGPFAFYVFGKEPWWATTHLYIRAVAGASVKEVSDVVRETVLKYAPNYPMDRLEVNFFDKELGYMYKKEEKLSTMVTMFTALAIIISLMGVFGLVLFETQYRRKEIGVRRVHGSSVMEILQMLYAKFAKLLLASFVVAAPVSWFIMDYYYSTFAYSADLSWWVFAVALLMVSLIVFAVVTIGSWRAATENPVNSLKNE